MREIGEVAALADDEVEWVYDVFPISIRDKLRKINMYIYIYIN